jgi:hypothetical protein
MRRLLAVALWCLPGLCWADVAESLSCVDAALGRNLGGTAMSGIHPEKAARRLFKVVKPQPSVAEVVDRVQRESRIANALLHSRGLCDERGNWVTLPRRKLNHEQG